jgi:hypothetical protein
MRRSLMLIRLLSILLLCVVVEAQDNVGKVEQVEGRQTGPLLFSISNDKPSYGADEVITITSELRNVSDHDVTITMRDALQLFSMDVMLPGPEWLPFRGRAVMSEEGSRKKYREGGSSHSGRVLKPGEALESQFELNKLYVMPVVGKYKVTFYFRAPDSVAKGQNVVSNEVVFSIVDKKVD